MSTKSRYSNGLLELYEDTTGERVNPTGAPIVIDEDFLYPSLVVNAYGALTVGSLWAKKIVGAGPPTVAGNANDVNGTLSCTLLVNSEKEDAEISAGDQLVFSALQGLVFEARVNVAVLPTLNGQVSWGMLSAWADGHDNITYGAYFTARAATGGVIYCDSRDGATSKDVASALTVAAGDYHIYRIDFSDPTHIRFFIDGAEGPSGGGANIFPWAASAANSKLQPFLGCYKASGAGLGTITIDYIRVWQKRS